MTALSVGLVDPARTLELRQRVLRPHQTVAEMAAATDDVPGLFAVAATLGDQVVSCAVAHPAPLLPDRPSAWRLRGMATDPAHRGAGIGGQVLDFLVEEVRRRGGHALWCHARVPARSLYERAGFTAGGEPWEEPRIGPHVRMQRDL